jgi:hypothetical protein
MLILIQNFTDMKTNTQLVISGRTALMELMRDPTALDLFIHLIHNAPNHRVRSDMISIIWQLAFIGNVQTVHSSIAVVEFLTFLELCSTEEKYRTIMGNKGVIELLLGLLVNPSSTVVTKARVAGAMWNLIWNSKNLHLSYFKFIFFDNLFLLVFSFFS